MYGSDDKVRIKLFSKNMSEITRLALEFSKWKFYIDHCLPKYSSANFTVTPLLEARKTWEFTVTTEYMKIKCNGVEVLHFLYRNSNVTNCRSRVEGQEVAKVKFRMYDTASKSFFDNGSYNFYTIMVQLLITHNVIQLPSNNSIISLPG